MKILICIKYSLDVSEIKVDSTTKNLSLAGVPRKIGNIDKNIIEAAVTLAESHGGTVHAITFGPASAKESFREALAMGVEDITLVEDPLDGQGGPAVSAMVLATAVEKIGDADIVLCGEVSDDGFTYQIPPRIAQRLSLPLISFAREIKVDAGDVIVNQDLEDSSQTVKAAFPVIITVTEETNTPRRPTLMDAMKAKKKPVYLWQTDADLGLAKETLENRVGLKRIDTRGIVVDRKQQTLQGVNPGELANQLVDLLIQEEILEGGA